MPLSHFSEDPVIARFVPRPPLARPEVEPLVWAIDDWHAPLYFFPRDCPRVCFWPLPTTTPEEYARWFAVVPGRMVIAIESAWLERLRGAHLYRYRMPEATFADTHDHGVHVSREAVVPLGVEPVGDLLAALIGAGVELRITPSLVQGNRISNHCFHTIYDEAFTWQRIRLHRRESGGRRRRSARNRSCGRLRYHVVGDESPEKRPGNSLQTRCDCPGHSYRSGARSSKPRYTSH